MPVDLLAFIPPMKWGGEREGHSLLDNGEEKKDEIVVKIASREVHLS